MLAYHVSIFYLINFLAFKLFTAVRSALHFKISLSKSTADPDLHKDPATFASCLLRWSLHSLQNH